MSVSFLGMLMITPFLIADKHALYLLKVLVRILELHFVLLAMFLPLVLSHNCITLCK